MSAPRTPGPWALNRMDSAVEFAGLKGETLAEHEGYYRTNSGAWIVTASETDEEGYQVGGPVCEVSFKGKAKRGEAYRAPDPEGQANARLIAAAPDGFEAGEEAIVALNAMMDSWFDYHDAHSLTQPVTGAAGNAFDRALAAREKLEAFVAKARGEQS